MSKIVILAETGSDITEEVAKEYGIKLVPMHVSFGKDTKDDGTFPAEEIYAYYEKTVSCHGQVEAYRKISGV